MPKRSKKNVSAPPLMTIRRCANVKSQKHPDVRCPCPATQGEFCARHSKHPKRFKEKSPLITAETLIFNRLDHDSATLIQKIWRGYCIRIRFLRQGPAACLPSLSNNNTDVYTLEPVDQIPILYRWSTVDSKKNIWLFDIRTLGMLHQQENFRTLSNPYTREPFSENTMQEYLKRVEWLRSKKYYVFHNDNEQVLTPEQAWHQRVLDVFLKLDMLGYYTSLKWFEDLSVRQLCKFYFELYELWFFRIGLSAEQKSALCPGWQDHIFRHNPFEFSLRRDLKAVRTILLDHIEHLITKGGDKQTRALGAMYVMTAFALASSQVHEHYEWLLLE